MAARAAAAAVATAAAAVATAAAIATAAAMAAVTGNGLGITAQQGNANDREQRCDAEKQHTIHWDYLQRDQNLEVPSRLRRLTHQ